MGYWKDPQERNRLLRFTPEFKIATAQLAHVAPVAKGYFWGKNRGKKGRKRFQHAVELHQVEVRRLAKYLIKQHFREKEREAKRQQQLRQRAAPLPAQFRPRPKSEVYGWDMIGSIGCD